jgi:hypothetical protein
LFADFFDDLNREMPHLFIHIVSLTTIV